MGDRRLDTRRRGPRWTRSAEAGVRRVPRAAHGALRAARAGDIDRAGHPRGAPAAAAARLASGAPRRRRVRRSGRSAHGRRQPRPRDRVRGRVIGPDDRVRRPAADPPRAQGYDGRQGRDRHPLGQRAHAGAARFLAWRGRAVPGARGQLPRPPRRTRSRDRLLPAVRPGASRARMGRHGGRHLVRGRAERPQSLRREAHADRPQDSGDGSRRRAQRAAVARDLGSGPRRRRLHPGHPQQRGSRRRAPRRGVPRERRAGRNGCRGRRTARSRGSRCPCGGSPGTSDPRAGPSRRRSRRPQRQPAPASPGHRRG